MPHLKIKTALDGLGVDSNGAVVVIELKCTSFRLAEHASRYRTRCRKKACMSFMDGVPNTEETAHQLQTAFGMLALRRCISDHIPIRGVIVICAQDGTVMHEVQKKFVKESIFSFPMTVTGGRTGTVTFAPLPDGQPAEHILSKFTKLGYTIRQPRLKRLGSFVLKNAKGDLLVAAIVHVKSQASPVSKDRINQLKKDAATLWTRRRKSVAVCAYLVKHTANGTQCVIERVRHHRRVSR